MSLFPYVKQLKLKQVLNRILQLAKPVKNLVQFFINLTTSKTKQSKTPTLNKTPQKISSDIQVKKVDHKQQIAITSFFEKTFDPVSQSSPTVITVSKECISELEPGVVFDACTYMSFEDYPEIIKYGRDIIKKLENKPIYVLDTTKKEYHRKKCPKDRFEIVRDVEYTGKPRNFNNTLAELQKSLGVEIYYVKVENSPEIRRLAKKLLPDLKMFGLHEPDSTYLAFTQFTKSTMITSDGALNKCCLQAQCAKSIEFQEFLDKIMQPSPITIVLRERRNYYKNRKHPHWEKGVFTKF